MISWGIDVHYFAQIRLNQEAKFGEDPLKLIKNEAVTNPVD